MPTPIELLRQLEWSGPGVKDYGYDANVPTCLFCSGRETAGHVVYCPFTTMLVKPAKLHAVKVLRVILNIAARETSDEGSFVFGFVFGVRLAELYPALVAEVTDQIKAAVLPADPTAYARLEANVKAAGEADVSEALVARYSDPFR